MGGGAHGRSRRLLYRRARLRGGGRRIVRRRIGDIVVNQIRWRLDMIVRGWLSERLLLASQESGFDDRLVAGSKRLLDDLLGLKVDAKHGSVRKHVAASVAVTLGKMHCEQLKNQ